MVVVYKYDEGYVCCRARAELIELLLQSITDQNTRLRFVDSSRDIIVRSTIAIIVERGEGLQWRMALGLLVEFVSVVCSELDGGKF